MKQTSNYPSLFILTVIFVAGLLASYTEVKSEQIELPGGFKLGSSLDEARQHSSSRGWELAQFSPEQPWQWIVEGSAETQIGLFVCGDKVTGVHQYQPGDLDEFADIVLGFIFSHGQPDIQVITFMAGGTKISNVDARFTEFEGLNVNVQLSSTAGRLGISTNYFKVGECTEK
ncbi:hypothetical protein GN278_05190 [Rhodobacteraceae bacterium Araon29]